MPHSVESVVTLLIIFNSINSIFRTVTVGCKSVNSSAVSSLQLSRDELCFLPNALHPAMVAATYTSCALLRIKQMAIAVSNPALPVLPERSATACMPPGLFDRSGQYNMHSGRHHIDLSRISNIVECEAQVSSVSG